MLSALTRSLKIQPAKDLRKPKKPEQPSGNKIFQAPFKREAPAGFFLTLLSAM